MLQRRRAVLGLPRPLRSAVLGLPRPLRSAVSRAWRGVVDGLTRGMLGRAAAVHCRSRRSAVGVLGHPRRWSALELRDGCRRSLGELLLP